MGKIEKGVPMPNKRSANLVKIRFAEFEVDDSAFYSVKETKSDSSKSLQIKLMSQAKHHIVRYRAKCKFASRQVTEDGKVGVRIWRIE